MPPWDFAAPSILYKFMRPERLDVLSECRICFSLRTAFEDDHELQPDYAAFGTQDEIQRFMVSNGWPQAVSKHLARLVAIVDGFQTLTVRNAQKNIKSIDKVGVLCLTETAGSERMWIEYSDRSRGFIVAFDTAHAGFRNLTEPRGVGKVSYSDRAFETFLGMIERNVFEPLYRKRMKYAYENEWRAIRLLTRLEPDANGIFLSPFDPAIVAEIIIRQDCVVKAELRQLLTTDSRYQHVKMRTE
jgi:hypothetical protein